MDRIFNTMLRGFGWRLGSRAAYKLPLIPAIIVVVVLHYVIRAF